MCSNQPFHFFPQHDFFGILHNILLGMEEVSDLQPIDDAHVPVMKFKFQGISIDLLYASVSLLIVPEVSSKMLLCIHFGQLILSMLRQLNCIYSDQ